MSNAHPDQHEDGGFRGFRPGRMKSTDFLSDDEIDTSEEEDRPSFGQSQPRFMSFTSGATLKSEDVLRGEHHDEDVEMDEKSDEEEDLARTSFGMGPNVNQFMSTQNSARQPSKPIPQSSKLQSTYGIGAKLLGKMGYVEGKGLGQEGKGIVEPIQQKLRPTLLGVGGIDERVSTQRKPRTKKSVGTIDLHETSPIEWLLNSYQKSLSLISRFNVAEVEVFTSVLDAVATDVDAAYLGDKWIMGNAKLGEDRERKLTALLTSANSELESFVDEMRVAHSRKESMDMRFRGNLAVNDELAVKINSLEAVLEAVQASKGFSDLPSVTGSFFTAFGSDSLKETLGLVFSFIKRSLLEEVKKWDVLHDPQGCSVQLTSYIASLKAADSGMYDYESIFESFVSALYLESWLPSVEAAFNDWDPLYPSSMVLFLEHWIPNLPSDVQSRLMFDIIIPKLSLTLDSWRVAQSSSKAASPALWFGSWCRTIMVISLDESLEDRAQQALQSHAEDRLILNAKINPYPKAVQHRVSEYIDEAAELVATLWCDERPDVVAALLKDSVSPLLERYLKAVVLAPGAFDFKEIDRALNWTHHFETWRLGISAVEIVPTVLGPLLRKVFIPSWLASLHTWLKDPRTEAEEIALWYEAWDGAFPASIRRLPDVDDGFHQALDLINESLDMESHERHGLRYPSESRESTPVNPTQKKPKAIPKSLQSTFKDVVEAYCLDHEMFLKSTNSGHDRLGHRLYRISSSPSGSGGVACFFDDNVVWLQTKTDRTKFDPVALEDVHDYIMTFTNS